MEDLEKSGFLEISVEECMDVNGGVMPGGCVKLPPIFNPIPIPSVPGCPDILKHY